MEIELREYQTRALANIETAEREGVRRPLVVHPTGTGKGHPGHTDILTVQGWRKWAELMPGDRVFGSYGMSTEVTAVYDRGVLPTYRVTFSDRSTIEADGDHLWAVQDYRYRRTSREQRVVSTSEIMAEGLTFGTSRRWAVPTTQVLYQVGSPFLPIDAYTLGSLIANGGLTGTGTALTTPDPEVVERIRRADRHVIRKSARDEPGECPRYSLPGLSPRLRDLGLNVHSRDKFIPDSYLLAGPGERLALLQGLMDGDGSSREGRRTANYHTTSPRLAEDVRHLVMSLGGTATVNALDRERDGNTYQDITVMILAPSWLELFSSSRKQNRAAPGRTFEPRRTIVAIDRIEDQEIRCITVAAPDHLYVVGRDFIVTHNTVTFGRAIEARADRGRSIVLVHREELAAQAIEKLSWQAPHLSTGVVKAGLDETDADVVVASVPTVHRDERLRRLVESASRSPFGTIIADEAHHAPSPSWTKVLQGLGAFNAHGPLAVGFTATPERDGKTLGVWQKVVSYMSIREAIHGGYLVPILPALVIETKMDMTRIRKGKDGDLSGGDLGREMEDSGAIEEIADGLIEHASDRKILAFTPTVATSHALAAALVKRGMAAEAVDGETETDLRTAIKRRLKTGETQCVVNCGVFTEGFDEPSIDCVAIARATKFHGFYIQMAGRGTRLSPGKANLLIIDFVGATQRHDLITRVDIGDELDTQRGKPGEETTPQACPTCEEACEVTEHRCSLCHRYLPAGRVRDGEHRHENCQASKAGKVDVFGASRLRWLPVEDGWCLGAGQEIVVMVPAGLDTWRLASYRNAKLEILHEQLPADWAMGIGEDRAKAFQKLVERDARWLRQPVSDQQRSRLVREGLPENKLGRVRTRGDAADLITRISGRRAVRKLATR
jgi:superfamily II DNA or RNA helicase